MGNPNKETIDFANIEKPQTLKGKLIDLLGILFILFFIAVFFYGLYKLITT